MANFAIRNDGSTQNAGPEPERNNRGDRDDRDDPGYDSRYAPIRPKEIRGGEGSAIASLVIGIFAMMGSCTGAFAVPLAVLGVIGCLLGIALGAKGKEGGARGIAIAGMVLCSVALVLWLAFGALNLFAEAQSTGGGG
ncbi:MAG: hypothetical protein ACYTGB_20475 [Planctomycetota bacterium]